MISRAYRTAFVFAVAVGLLGTTACGRNLRGFDEVEQAFDHPTGQISQGTAPTIFSRGLTSGSANESASVASTFDTTGSIAFGLAEMGQELATSSQYVVDCNHDVKFNGKMQPTKITVGCQDSADFSGELVIDFVWKDDLVSEVYLDFNDWCSGGECLNGSMGFKYDLAGAAGSGITSTFLATARFTVTQDGVQTAAVDWAFRATSTLEGGSLEWLVYADDNGDAESWVLSASVTAAGGSLELRGANGSFTCDYAADAASGQCTDSDGNSFSWTSSVEA